MLRKRANRGARCRTLRSGIVTLRSDRVDHGRREPEEAGPIDELSARRAGRREANLRGLNERIANAQYDAGNGHKELQLVCECSLQQCEDGIRVPTQVFEQVREHGRRFVVVPGHILDDVERAILEGDGWTLVEKHGVAARAAEQERS